MYYTSSSLKKQGYIKSKGNESPQKLNLQSLAGESRKWPVIEKKKEPGSHLHMSMNSNGGVVKELYIIVEWAV